MSANEEVDVFWSPSLFSRPVDAGQFDPVSDLKKKLLQDICLQYCVDCHASTWIRHRHNMGTPPSWISFHFPPHSTLTLSQSTRLSSCESLSRVWLFLSVTMTHSHLNFQAEISFLVAFLYLGIFLNSGIKPQVLYHRWIFDQLSHRETVELLLNAVYSHWPSLFHIQCIYPCYSLPFTPPSPSLHCVHKSVLLCFVSPLLPCKCVQYENYISFQISYWYFVNGKICFLFDSISSAMKRL